MSNTCQMSSASVTSANDVPACTTNEPTQQMGRNPLYDPPTVSETSFPNRYTMRPADPSLNTSNINGSCTGGRKRKNRRKFQSLKNRKATLRRGGGRRKRRFTTKNHKRHRHSGGGYSFLLDECPIGGLPERVRTPDL